MNTAQQSEDSSFVRLAARLCLIGAVVGVVSALVTGFVPPAVADDRYSYPYTPKGFVVAQLVFLLNHVLLLVGILGLSRSGAAGTRRLGRSGLRIAVAGMGLLSLCEVRALTLLNVGFPSPPTDFLDIFFGIASMMIGAGLVMAGVSVARAGRWTAWRRFTPLACGAAVFVIVMPALFGSFLAGRLAIGTWMLLFVALAVAMRAETGCSTAGRRERWASHGAEDNGGLDVVGEARRYRGSRGGDTGSHAERSRRSSPAHADRKTKGFHVRIQVARRLLLAAVAMLLVSAAAPTAEAVPPPGGLAEDNARTTEVQILALNDFHGQLRPPDSTSSGGRIGATPAGGAEYLAQYVRDLEATNPRNTLFVSAGDVIGATPLISAIFHDEPTVEAMNLMGLDYNGVGNHEFDEGSAELVRMQEGGCHPVDGCFGGDGFDGADFQFLAANVTYEDTGETIFPPYAIHEFNGVDVAIVGMTLKGTPSIVTAAATENLLFHDEADSVNALVPHLKAAGIETIIVLLHEGGSAGIGLTETTVNSCGGPGAPPSGPVVDVIQGFDREIDLVVTGHTNWAINCPDFAGTGIMVTGAASAGRVVTDVDLTISRATKDVVAARIDNVIVRRDVFPAATDLSALIAHYGEIAAPIENRVIGTATAPLTRVANAAGESSLGDIIADAQVWATSGPSWPAANGAPAVASFMNAGGIRADINAGPITYGEAFSVQPFANVLVTMDMTGAQIDAVLEQQFSVNRVLQIPASLTYDLKADSSATNRVTNIRIDGVPIDPTKTYRVTVNNFLADGGDGFTVFGNGTNRFVGEIDLDAFSRYIEVLGSVSPGPQNRITLVP